MGIVFRNLLYIQHRSSLIISPKFGIGILLAREQRVDTTCSMFLPSIIGGRGLYVISVTRRIESINFVAAAMYFRIITKYETVGGSWILLPLWCWYWQKKKTMYFSVSQPQGANRRQAVKESNMYEERIR
jgi:hypothetical protein